MLVNVLLNEFLTENTNDIIEVTKELPINTIIILVTRYNCNKSNRCV